jgi:hypothetical protein
MKARRIDQQMRRTGDVIASLSTQLPHALDNMLRARDLYQLESGC